MFLDKIQRHFFHPMPFAARLFKRQAAAILGKQQMQVFVFLRFNGCLKIAIKQ